MAIFAISMAALTPNILPEAHAGVDTVVTDMASCESLAGAVWTGPATCDLGADFEFASDSLTIDTGIIFNTD